MFVGHFGVAFLLKKKFKEIPLWLLFSFVQFPDLLGFSLMIVGLERVRYNPAENPFLRVILEYFPYSHSLIMNVIFCLIAFSLFWKIRNRTWGLVLAGGILSHWFIDFVMHTPDLPLFFNSFKVGLSLWQWMWLSFALEIAIVAGSGYYLYRGSNGNKRLAGLILFMLVGFSGLMLSEWPEILTNNLRMMTASLLILYLVFIALAYWSERGK